MGTNWDQFTYRNYWCSFDTNHTLKCHGCLRLSRSLYSSPTKIITIKQSLAISAELTEEIVVYICGKFMDLSLFKSIKIVSFPFVIKVIFADRILLNVNVNKGDFKSISIYAYLTFDFHEICFVPKTVLKYQHSKFKYSHFRVFQAVFV